MEYRSRWINKRCFVKYSTVFPFGFLLQMINKNNKINLLQIFIPFTTSISIEILQYIFSVGVTDITDVICNTLGAILGAISYLVFNIIFKK